jgi:hypothetical protein
MTDKKIQHFLLVFDHEAGKLIHTEDFGTDQERAVKAYGDCEEKYRDVRTIEIVLIGSDSFETVKLTHANYFDGSVATSKYLVGL